MRIPQSIINRIASRLRRGGIEDATGEQVGKAALTLAEECEAKGRPGLVDAVYFHTIALQSGVEE